MPQPVVSIGLPITKIEYLQEAIECLNNQTFKDFELIVVDDGSEDDSWSVIEELAAEDSRVFGVRLRRNFGKAAAISAGAVVASRAAYSWSIVP